MQTDAWSSEQFNETEIKCYQQWHVHGVSKMSYNIFIKSTITSMYLNNSFEHIIDSLLATSCT